MKEQGAGLPRYRLPPSSLPLRYTSTKSFGNPRTGKFVERLKGYIGGLPSAPLIPSREKECGQLQRGADRLRRAGKALPSAEGHVATLLREFLECAVDMYEGLSKVRM